MDGVRRPTMIVYSCCSFLALVAATAILIPHASAASGDLLDIMPHPSDRGSLWWHDGFPGIAQDARWYRSVQTGHYRFTIDTEQIGIPHMGGLDGAWRDLPPSDIELSLRIGDKTYRCVGAEPHSRFGGPRLIDAGTFLQRADVTGLRFVAEDGSSPDVETRLETIAWPDRLGWLFAARPAVEPILPGPASFGRSGGGFGFDGSTWLELSPDEARLGETFSIVFWLFVPSDFRAGQHSLSLIHI